MKKHDLLSVSQRLVFVAIMAFVTACGGGGGGTDTPGDDVVTGIVGIWAGPCYTTEGVDSVNIRSTATYYADGTTSDFTLFYQDTACTTPNSSAPIRKDSSGTYRIGTVVTTTDGRTANEIDITYTIALLDGLDLTFGGTVTITIPSIVRIEGNTLLHGDLAPGSLTVRPNTLIDAIAMTRQ